MGCGCEDCHKTPAKIIKQQKSHDNRLRGEIKNKKIIINLKVSLALFDRRKLRERQQGEREQAELSLVLFASVVHQILQPISTDFLSMIDFWLESATAACSRWSKWKFFFPPPPQTVAPNHGTAAELWKLFKVTECTSSSSQLLMLIKEGSLPPPLPYTGLLICKWWFETKQFLVKEINWNEISN